MANTTLTEHLQFHGQENKTGSIVVKNSTGAMGQIFLHHGQVVHAESPGGGGLFSVFSMLGWQDASVNWNEGAPTPRISMEEGPDALLFQYAQLEDQGKADEQSLRELFNPSGSSPSSGIKVTDLKRYRIVFEVLNKEFDGVIFTLEKPVTLVGRSEDCDVTLPEPTLSSHHCSIAQEANCIRVTDLGSTNGTRINGNIISEGILQVGDEVFLGSVALRMTMKMQRHLVNRAPSSSAAASLNAPVSDQHSTTMKIDADALRKRIASEKARQNKGPITWKTVEEDEKRQKTKTTNSIFGLFGKKQ